MTDSSCLHTRQPVRPLPTRDEPLGVGIIGAGIMGSAHAAGFAADPRSRLLGTAGLPLSSAKDLASRFGGRATDDYREVLADPRIELVSVATPDHLHHEICRAALEAGKHVFVEKPLTTDLTQADALVALAARSDRTLMTAFNHRWIPAYNEAHQLIRSGEIGTPVMAYARKNDRIHVPTSMLTWAERTTCAWFLSSHDVDLVNWFIQDRPAEVFASSVSGVLTGRGIDTPDAIQAQVRYRNGAVATFESCWIYPDTFPTMTDSYIEVIGTEGVVQLPRQSDQLEVATSKSFSYPRTSIGADVHGVRLGAVTAALQHMITCVISGEQPLVTAQSSRDVIAALDAVHRSLASGTLERVDQP